MASSPLAILQRLESLAKPVLELILEAVDAVQGSATKRDAARRLGTLAAKKILLG
jgi:hypothetical protein